MQYRVGIDEAGRGPIAGPVAVGAVLAPEHFNMEHLAGIRDSKQLPQHKRDEWYATLHALQKSGELAFAVSFSTQQYIDKHGIAPATNRALQKALRQLKAEPDVTHVLLDNALTAPATFHSYESITRGDEREPLIALASIAAKVRRDEKMIAASKQHPEYGFEQNKGYGTKSHYAAIHEHGVCSLHRKTFTHVEE